MKILITRKLALRLHARLEPLPNCKHGQKAISRWWQVDFLVCKLEWMTGGGPCFGRRLWVYTLKGGRHFDVLVERLGA